MNKKTKKIIKYSMFFLLAVSIIFLSISACLLSIRLGVGIKFDHPFCWASFLQFGIINLVAWAFTKELMYY